ncbi:protein p13 MTCP-1-like [Myotis lucifugus]|uniref:protein p13 MTCP-1-like n=1 Tax=Myotis lucifugus TaxID=59463 RepID=UPI0006D7324F|nr:protein p13 MTCP-1-like [Myotis lucifugus]
MPRLPSNVQLNLPPIYLSICGPSMYEDEKQRKWMHLVMDTGGVPQVQLRHVNIPSEHIALATNPLISSTMPPLWTLLSGSQYVDSMLQLWCILHHSKVDGVEEMILELMEDS